MFVLFHISFSSDHWGRIELIFSGFICLVLLCLLFPQKKRMCPVLTGNTLSLISLSCSQKATKKTDKPRPEDKDDLDITEMSNEDLQERLTKYGVNPGPIVGRSIELVDTNLFCFSLNLTCELSLIQLLFSTSTVTILLPTQDIFIELFTFRSLEALQVGKSAVCFSCSRPAGDVPTSVLKLCHY